MFQLQELATATEQTSKQTTLATTSADNKKIDTFVRVTGKFCQDPYGDDKTLEESIDACNGDKNCYAVEDMGCDGVKTVLCREGGIAHNVHNSNLKCIYKKVGEQHPG